MNYKKYNVDTWNRREHFSFYRQRVPCGFSLTTKIDITALLSFLSETNYKFYPTIIYLLTKVANQYPEFRLAIKDEELIIWDSLDPLFTIFHQETETFSAVWTPYSSDIAYFMADYIVNVERYKSDLALFPQAEQPGNFLNISSLLWTSFDSFNLNVANFTDYFSPIITMGKYQSESDRILLPLSIQTHHATCDGFHVARFLNTLQTLCNQPLSAIKA